MCIYRPGDIGVRFRRRCSCRSRSCLHSHGVLVSCSLSGDLLVHRPVGWMRTYTCMSMWDEYVCVCVCVHGCVYVHGCTHMYVYIMWDACVNIQEEFARAQAW